MSRFNRHLARTGFAGLALGLASGLLVSAAPPAGAAVPLPAGQPVQPRLNGTTPMCLVGAAVLYPFFLGNVLLTSPVDLVKAAPGYWAGGDTGHHKAGPGDRFPGWLPACGLPGGGTPKVG